MAPMTRGVRYRASSIAAEVSLAAKLTREEQSGELHVIIMGATGNLNTTLIEGG